LAILGLALTGCGDPRLSAASPAVRRGPPPRLWLIKVSGEADAGQDIRLCADRKLEAGLTAIGPDFAGRPCRQEGYSSAIPPDQSYKCLVDGREFGIATHVSGRYPADFTAASTVVDLDAQRSVYSRALAIRRLGACPAGWKVGQATDQAGRKVTAAFIAGTDIAYQPPP
jgi:hypothetical protein